MGLFGNNSGDESVTELRMGWDLVKLMVVLFRTGLEMTLVLMEWPTLAAELLVSLLAVESFISDIAGSDDLFFLLGFFVGVPNSGDDSMGVTGRGGMGRDVERNWRKGAGRGGTGR